MKMKDVSFSTKISPVIKDEFLEIKDGLEKVHTDKINNQIALEKIIKLAKSALESGAVTSEGLLNESFDFGSGGCRKESMDSLLAKYHRTNEAINDLINEGPQALSRFGKFADVEVIDTLQTKDEIASVSISVPGIYKMVDKDTGRVVNVVGTNDIAHSISFTEKALNKGRINSKKSDEFLNKKYGKRAKIYKKFKDLSGYRIKYELVSLCDPKSLSGRAVILEIIKQNPDTYYDVDEFAKID